jgi:predicted LPLAT superfamily acyltransferase
MAQWTGKTRGSVLGYRIFLTTIRLLGLKAAYFILNSVSFHFYLFLPKQRKILESFYLNEVGIPEKKVKFTVRRNFNLLGQSIIDKMAFLIGKGDRITYSESGEIYLRELATKKQGAFLISGHVGNWDIAGNFLKGIDAEVSILMHQNEHAEILSLLDSQGSVPKFNIIPIADDFSHLIKIYQAIKQGHLVCMHADRYLDGAKTRLFNFFGKPAHFPIGPFQLIEKMKVPYSFVFAVKESTFGYALSATKPIVPLKKAEEIGYDFVLLLEEKVKAFPEQWFNYYDFYKS